MSTHSASVHCPAEQWPKEQAAGTLTLDFDARHRRRIRLITDQGEHVLLELPKAVAMADGDGLQLEDGRWLKVQAAAELIVEIRHHDPDQFMRLAWHLGNRHLPTEIRDRVLRIRPDQVVEHMLQSVGADLVKVEAPFQPEGGAQGVYGGNHNYDGSRHDHER